MSYATEKKEMVIWAHRLNQKGLVAARGGNMSYRVRNNKILITAHDCYLGYLREEDILLADLSNPGVNNTAEFSSERLLHLSIYRNPKFEDIRVVLHAHPPYTTAFFNYFDKLDIFSFETKFYLGDIAVVAQDTPTVAEPGPVIRELENGNIVVLKKHGVVAIGGNFKETFSLIELLEEQAKVNLMLKNKSEMRSPKSETNSNNKNHNGQSDIGGVEKQSVKKYEMLSAEHIRKLTQVINNDTQVQGLGRKYNLTCTLAVKNQDSNQAVCFYYEQGRITKTDNSETAEFVIIGKEDVLKKVFNKEIDPFVAATQGKVKTRGDFAKMGRWYPVLVKTFELWEQAPVI